VRAVSFRQSKVVAHSNFIAITDDRSSCERHHQTVGEFQTPAVPLQHGSKPASNAALIQLHVFVETKCCEDSFAVVLAETPEVQLAVIVK
jgi:hypothetical protein